MTLANPQRGEIEVEIDGERYVFVLNLGALAKMEAALCVNSIAKMQEKLSDPSVNDLLSVISVLSQAGGNTIDRNVMESWGLDRIETLSNIIMNVFSAQSSGEEAKTDTNPPTPPPLGANGVVSPSPAPSEAA